MRPRIGDRQQRLYTAIDEILHYVWDPIGVAGIPEARSEYRDYVPDVFGILERAGGEQELASYLLAVEIDRMGLSGRPKRARIAASMLTEWRNSLANESAEKPIARLP